MREIFRVFVNEGSCARAAEKLNELGILQKTKSYKSEAIVNEKKWTRNALQYVLRNPAYAGLREINKKNRDKNQETLKPQQRYQKVKASWPRIVDENTWEAVQMALDFSQVRERQRLKSKTKRFFLLSGTLRCAECGGSLMGASGHGKHAVYRYYVHRQVKGQKINCSFDWIPADDLEGKVILHLAKTLFQQGYLNQVEENVSQVVSSRRKDLEVEHQRVRTAIEKSDSDIQKAIDLQTKCDEPTVDEVFRDRIRTLGDQKKTLKRRLDEIENFLADSIDPKEARNVIKSNVEEFNRAWVKASPTMRKRLLAGVFSSMTLDSSNLNLYYRLDGAEMARIQQTQKEKALELGSGASPYGRSANRFNHFIHPALLIPPTVFNSWDKEVFIPRVGENGRGNPTTCCISYCHEIIDLFHLGRQGIFQKATPLYASGASLREIAKELGVSKTTIRKALIEGGAVLRSSNGSPSGEFIKTVRRHIGVAPYGFCVIRGQLVKDPKEQVNVQLILKLATGGKSNSAIADYLNDKKIKTRTGGRWDHSTIRSILKRNLSINKKSK